MKTDRICKRALVAAVLMLTFCFGSANAATVLIDWSTAALVTDPGITWNTLGTGPADVITTNLWDNSGAASGWSVAVDRDDVNTSGAGFGGTGINGPVGAVSPFDVTGDTRPTVDGLYVNNNNDGFAYFLFTGLSANTDYDFSLIGGRATGGKDGVIKVLQGTADTNAVVNELLGPDPVANSYPLLNDGTILDFTVTSDASGQIELRFFKGDMTTGSEGGSTFNAMSISEVVAPDLTAPLHVPAALNPTNTAVSVPPSSDLTIVFDEEVEKGSGNILIRRVEGNTIFETIDVTSPAVTVSTTNVTINPTSDLELGTNYWVEITNGVIQDLAGNPFAGITNSSQWAFTTVSAGQISIATENADNISNVTARLNATLGCPGTNATVIAYWWQTGSGTTNLYTIGTYSDQTAHPVSHTVSGLAPKTAYSFTFRATNATDDVWAATTNTFTTHDIPEVDTATGPTSDSPTSATLYGQVVTANGAVPSIVRIYFGDNDGGTTPSSWDTSFDISSWTEGVAFSTNVTDLLYGVEYSYRVYASNSYGEVWSTVTNFVTHFSSANGGGIALTQVEIGDFGASQYPVHAFDVQNESSVLVVGIYSDGDTVSNIWFGDGGGLGSGDVEADRVENSDRGYLAYFLNPSTASGLSVRMDKSGGNGTLAVFWELAGVDLASSANFSGPGGTSITTDVDDEFIVGIGWRNADDTLSPSGSSVLTRDVYASNLSNGGGGCIAAGSAAAGAAGTYDTSWSGGDTGSPMAFSFDPFPALSITNTAAANVTETTADLLGSLDATQSVFTVSLYWGTNNHATASAWENDVTASNVVVGTYTNVVEQSLSNQVAVTPNIQYYYTYMASNAVTNIWAQPNVPYVFATAAPEIDTLSPTNGAVDVGVEANLIATFEFPVVTNTTGSVVITNLSDNTLTATIAIGDTSQITVSGTTVTIAPSDVLAFDTQYAVLIDTNALKNSADVFFAGLTNSTQWAFTTIADNVVPSPSPMTFEVLPYADSVNSITMTATEATDPSTPIEYRFTNTVTGTVSDWSTSRSWTNTGLSQEVSYGYRVQARDALFNATAWSDEAEATIDPPGYIYEPFDYAAGTINGSYRNGGIGMAGAWSSSGSDNLYNIVTPGLSFTGLPTSGGMPRRPDKVGYAQINREISILNKTALVGDKTTIWFSILMRDAAHWADYAYDAFLFASAPIDGIDGSRRVVISSGQGLGVSFNYKNIDGTQYMNVHGIMADNGTTTVSAGSIPDASPGVNDQSTYLIAGQITWAGNGTNDTLRLFNIADPLAPQPLDSEAFATMTADFDQSLFDTLTMGTLDMAKLDEIRFAPSFNEVMGRAPDLDAPVHTALDPENAAINVPITTDLVITFDESVKAGFGSILVKQVDDDATVATLAATDAAVTYGGTSVTIDLPGELTDSTGYYVLITNGVMQDLAGNAFAGITTSAQWSFTTASADNDPPTPNPMTFEVAPTALDEISVSMTATAATDITPPITYFFTNTFNGDVSGWISSRTWTNANLAPAQTHTYRVKARDGIGNETQWSDPANVTLTLEPGGLIYEPFDYATGSINGKAGGVGFATAGWTATDSGSNPFTVVTPGLSLLDLPTTGLASGRALPDKGAEMHREITEGNKVALLQDSGHIWFSLLVYNREHWDSYENLAVVLSTGPFTSYSDAPGTAAPAISGGEGIGLAFNTLGSIHAFVVDDGVSAYSPDALTVSYNTTNFIVGKIALAPNGANDTVELFHIEYGYAAEPASGDAFATLEGDLDQSQFTTIAIASCQISIVDEIRFARTYREVIGRHPDSASVFRFR